VVAVDGRRRQAQGAGSSSGIWWRMRMTGQCVQGRTRSEVSVRFGFCQLTCRMQYTSV
jgi:hypothetical protein